VNPGLEPILTLAVNGGSPEFTVSHIVNYAHRTLMKDRLFTRIVDEITNSHGRLEWASSSSPSSSSALMRPDCLFSWLSFASDVSRQMFRDELTKDTVSCLPSHPNGEVGEDQANPPIRARIVHI